MSITEKLGKMGIPGFRSGKKWKIALATIGYFFILLIILAAISPNQGPKNTVPTVQTTSQPTVVQTTSQPTVVQTTSQPTVVQTTSILVSTDEPKVLSYSDYISSIGYYTVVGEIQNNLQSNINYVKITATFYDSQDNVIGTDFTYTDLETLKPGQKSPFEISSYPEKINPARFKLSISYSKTGNEPYGILEILSKSSKTDDLGYYKTVGEVKNSGNRKSTYVKVIATYYDSSGKVIGKSFTYTNPQDINSGDTAPFELRSYPNKITPSKYELVVQGN